MKGFFFVFLRQILEYSDEEETKESPDIFAEDSSGMVVVCDYFFKHF